MFCSLFLLNLKTFTGQKFRLIVLLLLLISISAVAGLAGDFFLTDGILAEPISIALVDLDNSAETRMILSAIVDEPDYIDLLEFVILSPREAYAALDDGTVTAIITFPEGFAHGMLMGQNIPFTVAYNSERPLASALVRVVTESFADMLRSSQIGVYVTLNFANTQEIPREQFDRILLAVNMRFIGLVMNRGEIFIHDNQSVTGGPDIRQAYLIAMYCALMLCAAFVMTDAMRQNFSRHFILKLKKRGVAPLKLLLACLAANFLLFVAINAGLGFLLLDFSVSTSSLLVIIVLTAAFAAFAAMIIFVFDSAFAAGSFSAVAVGISLFLSGGIIPIEFFGDGLSRASNFVFNTWAVRLIFNLLLDESLVIPVTLCLTFALIFAMIGCFAAYRKGRVPR